MFKINHPPFAKQEATKIFIEWQFDLGYGQVNEHLQFATHADAYHYFNGSLLDYLRGRINMYVNHCNYTNALTYYATNDATAARALDKCNRFETWCFTDDENGKLPTLHKIAKYALLIKEDLIRIAPHPRIGETEYLKNLPQYIITAAEYVIANP